MNYKKMTIFNTCGNITYAVCLWLLTVLVTWVSGYEIAGELALAVSIGNVVVSFQTFGVRTYQVSDVTEEYSGRQYVMGRYLTTAVGFIFCVVYCSVIDYPIGTTLVILTYALYRSGEAVSDAYWGELQKIGRLDIAAVSFFTKGLVLIVLTGIVLKQGGELYVGLALSAAAALTITFLCDRVWYQKLTGQGRMRLSPGQILAPLRSCFTLLLTTMFPMLLAALPRIFLERYHGTELLGYYGNISAPTALISSLVPSILVPIMTWYAGVLQRGEKRNVMRGLVTSLALCVLLGIMACAAVWIAGDWVMGGVFTWAILPYVHYLYPLIWSTVIYAWTMCANAVLISARETRAVSVFSGGALLAAVVVSIPLVQEMAISGAILVLAVSYSLQFLLQMIWILVWYHRLGGKT